MAGSPSFDTTIIERPRGLPRWVLWALLPVALSLGVVVGVGTATYRAVPAPSSEPEQPIAPDSSDQVHGEVPSSTNTGGNGGNSSSGTPLATVSMEAPWEIPGARAGAMLREPILPGPDGVEESGLSGLGPSDSGRPVSSLPILQARSILTERFSLMPMGDELPIGFTYQVMRGNHGGNLLVGLLHADDYRRWEQAVMNDEAAVKEWLESAAEAVRPQSQQEGFHLGWAIVDNVRRDPYDSFARHEVLLMEDRTFLVVRPLAATPTTALESVAIRPVTTVWLDPSGSIEAWHVYRPTLRFDGSDIYRPTSANPWR